MPRARPPETGPPEAVTIGESMVVLSPPVGTPLDGADAIALGVGGAESNVAACLAALGHRTAWVSRVGADPFGRMIVRQVAAGGVDVRLVETDPAAPTGIYAKDPYPDGTRVYYYRAGSAASRLDPAILDDPRLAGARLLHLSGITAALSESCRDLVARAVTERPVAGALVSFDVNYRPRLWPVGLASEVLRRLADRADLVFVGLDEARTLWHAQDPATVRRLLPGPQTVVVKDAAVGATAVSRSGVETVVPALRVPVVEPVGAGDAFAAGYLSARLRGRAPVAALRLGHLLAAHALAVPGDSAPPADRDQFDRLVALPEAEWAALGGEGLSARDGGGGGWR